MSRQRNDWQLSGPLETESTVPPSYRVAAAFATSIPDVALQEDDIVLLDQVLGSPLRSARRINSQANLTEMLGF